MAVTFAEMRARVSNVLKRKDVTVALLDQAITDSVRRIQRTLRTPMTESQAEAVVPTNFAGALNVPNDLLNLISIQIDGRELEQRSITEIRQLQKAPGGNTSLYYTRVAGQWLVAPSPPPGTLVHIDYHRDLSKLVNPTDTNVLLDVCPDLVMYGALIVLGDWAQDPRQANWAQGFATHFAEIQEQADRDLILNMSVAPLHRAGDY